MEKRIGAGVVGGGRWVLSAGDDSSDGGGGGGGEEHVGDDDRQDRIRMRKAREHDVMGRRQVCTMD